jgi:hypothetical protein
MGHNLVGTPTMAEPVKKFPARSLTGRLIVVFTRHCHWAIYRAKWIKVTSTNTLIAYFPKAGLCDLLRECPPHPNADRQRGPLFEKRRDRPFGVGVLTEQSSRPPSPPSQTETEYCQSELLYNANQFFLATIPWDPRPVILFSNWKLAVIVLT